LKSHILIERCGKRFLIIGLAPYYSARMEPNRYNLFFEMGNIHTTDPIPAVRRILEETKGKYDFSILLSHSGHLVDRELEKQLPPVDLWLEGHSHAVITEKRYSQSGKGECLGRITLELDEAGVRIVDSRQIALPERGSPGFDNCLEETQAAAEAILSRELPVVRELGFDPFRESELTNFICDCLKKEFGGDLALMHSGISEGPLNRPVSRKSLIENFPSKLNPTIYTVSGEKLLAAVKLSMDEDHIRQSGKGPGFRGRVLGCLGFSSNVTVTREPFSVEIDGKAVEPESSYTVVTDDYLQRGTGYPSLRAPDEAARFDKRFIRDLVQEYLTDEAVFHTASIPRERGTKNGI
ncbi:MAG: 5'-nucleotidase C-terminal domain-containing protein, partial [Faecousia sp.]